MGQIKGGLNMEQKRVSFKVAEAIKEAGYPQDNEEMHYSYFNDNEEIICRCPHYLDVWLWLWREKDIRINTRDYFSGLAVSESSSSYDSVSYTDPEEAIIAAIEYLVDNNLIK